MKLKLNRLLAPIAAAVMLLGGAGAANAGLMVQLSSGGNTVTIADNGYGDLSLLEGSIAAFNMGLNNWEVVVTSGTSASSPFSMHLTAGPQGTASDAPITIKITQTGLGAGSGPMTFFADGGGSGPWDSAASWWAWVDDNDVAFGQGVQVHSSNGYATSAGSVQASLSDTYSATIVTTFDYRNMTQVGLRAASLDITMGVPEPTTLALVGLGLIGAGAIRRRKAGV